jgi:hypothetical protein
MHQRVKTDRNMHKKKPYYIICDYERGTLILIYAEISGNTNVIKKEAKMILKYKKQQKYSMCGM